MRVAGRERVNKIRILIADGNVPADRDVLIRFNGCAPSEMFDRQLKSSRSDIETEILFPTDEGSHCRLPLEAYDGILITGSNSNIHKREAGTIRQIEFTRAAFASGTPIFGVCWGLQLATVALGGEVFSSQVAECGCEVPFATGIRLTKEGRGHPMHRSRSNKFDCFSFHFDQVTRLPSNSTITANNRHFIQAAEIRGEKSVFWGVQYHPELNGSDMAGFLRGCVKKLVADGRYKDDADVEQAAQVVSQFMPGTTIAEQVRAHFEEIDLDRFEFRPLEITNWIERLVIPSMEAK